MSQQNNFIPSSIQLEPTIGVFNFPASELQKYKPNLVNQSGVYAIYNPATSIYYIGSSVNLWKRINNYRQAHYVSTYPDLPICQALVEYGFNNIIIMVLQYTTRENATVQEQKFLDAYKLYYNVDSIASSPQGRRHSEETKEKMRAAKLGTKVSPEALENMRASWKDRGKGIPKSEDHKAKISAAIKGKPGNSSHQISVLDMNTGVTTVYIGMTKAAAGIGTTTATIRYYMNRQYKHYMITNLSRKVLIFIVSFCVLAWKYFKDPIELHLSNLYFFIVPN